MADTETATATFGTAEDTSSRMSKFMSNFNDISVKHQTSRFGLETNDERQPRTETAPWVEPVRTPQHTRIKRSYIGDHSSFIDTKRREEERQAAQEAHKAAVAAFSDAVDEKYADILAALPKLEERGYTIEIHKSREQGSPRFSRSIEISSPLGLGSFKIEFVGKTHPSCIIYGDENMAGFLASDKDMQEIDGLPYADRFIAWPDGPFASELHLDDPQTAGRLFDLHAALLETDDLVDPIQQSRFEAEAAEPVDSSRALTRFEGEIKTAADKRRDLETLRTLSEFMQRLKEDAPGMRREVIDTVKKALTESPTSDQRTERRKAVQDMRISLKGLVLGGLEDVDVPSYEGDKWGKKTARSFLDRIDQTPGARQKLEEIFNFCEENNMAVRFDLPGREQKDNGFTGNATVSITVSPGEDHYHPVSLHDYAHPSRENRNYIEKMELFNETLSKSLNDDNWLSRRVQSKKYDF